MALSRLRDRPVLRTPEHEVSLAHIWARDTKAIKNNVGRTAPHFPLRRMFNRRYLADAVRDCYAVLGMQIYKDWKGRYISFCNMM